MSKSGVKLFLIVDSYSPCPVSFPTLIYIDRYRYYWSEMKLLIILTITSFVLTSVCAFVRLSKTVLRVDCGWGKSAPDCSRCGLCGGDCHWIERASLCVHTSGMQWNILDEMSRSHFSPLCPSIPLPDLLWRGGSEGARSPGSVQTVPHQHGLSSAAGLHLTGRQ